jgi:copper homeostasis protein
MLNHPTLEVACFSLPGLLAAVRAGAHRIELCENPSAGGTTPAYGFLKLARQATSLPVFPIIRPREGDFLYTDAEFEMMKADIKLCKSMDFEGVVLGMLTADGSIDLQRTQQLVNIAYPMEVTFHRAFDRCKEPLAALEQLINMGCNRVLTSGQKPTALQGATLIRDLVLAANHRLVVMPGGGIRADNIAQLMAETKASEFHGAFRKVEASAMQFEVQDLDESLCFTSVDEAEVKSTVLHLSAADHCDYSG